MEQLLHIITGPTAVGKTEYALAYAAAHNAEIVSCDASLIYRGMDIGTAKPSPAELARVPHHLIDLNPVNVPYDIVAYVRDAQAAVADIFSRGRSVLVSGGSGFYLKSFFTCSFITSLIIFSALFFIQLSMIFFVSLGLSLKLRLFFNFF